MPWNLLIQLESLPSREVNIGSIHQRLNVRAQLQLSLSLIVLLSYRLVPSLEFGNL